MWYGEHEDRFNRTEESFNKFLRENGQPERFFEIKNVDNIWEFYKEIGYDYKAKKWIFDDKTKQLYV